MGAYGTGGYGVGTFGVGGAGASPAAAGPRVYATPDDLADWVTVPPDAGRRLRMASAVVDYWTRAAVYDTDVHQMPTDPDVAAAFRDAVCAQVEAWLSVGSGHTGPGAAGWGQVTAGRITLARGSGSSPAGAGVVSGRQLSEGAALILANAGLLGHPR